MLFIPTQNLDLLLRYLKFCPVCHVVSRPAKQLDRKVEVYFKTYHDKNREKINYKPNIIPKIPKSKL